MNLFHEGRRSTRILRCAALAALLLLPTQAFAADACRGPIADAHTNRARDGVDPGTSLLSRLRPPSPEAIRQYVESGVASARPYRLNAAEKERIEKALLGLPEVHRRKLHAHLRHLSFIDVPAGAGNGLTAKVNEGSFPVFDLTLRAGILDEPLSEFLTTKERAVFADDGSGVSVAVEAPGSALDYVLLHEATHVVDHALSLTSRLDPRFTASIWLDRTSLHPSWASMPIASTLFRRAPRIPIAAAPGLYGSLAESPFVSLYATAAAPEDFAELVAWREMARRFRQPISITLRNDRGEQIYRMQPLANPRLTARFAAVDALLAACASRRM
ncbi:hypothetical protein [Allosphingosinicella deserti]|uniref:Secreted protein n=1 Tax=Allosphingosinicella deserti TaxID=2116704 RepID=A0A2P7QNT2_9SPHN|nr:hypothetical protein [Sphingomonas deserti]PSJ39616.1 hypothetical protein C7I55_13530 [Sphingomonas deserti]